MQLDVGHRLNLLLGRFHLRVIGTDVKAAKWDEGQVAVEKGPFLDGGKLRLVGLDVDIGILKAADLLPVAVDERLPVAFGCAPVALSWLSGMPASICRVSVLSP
jgi:hypothetical protein